MDADLRAALADLPASRWWAYRLPPVLERRFVGETGAARNSQIRFWLGIGLAFSWLTVVLDFFSTPDVWWFGVLLRAVAVTPAFLLARWLLGAARPRWLEALASFAPHSIALLTLMIMFAVSAPFDALRSSLALAFGIIWATVLIPLRIWDAVTFAVATLLLGDATNGAAAIWNHSFVDRPEVIVATHMIVGLAVLARLLAERESRLSFILGFRLQVRADDLARSNAKLLELSSTDPLTGLANRRSFDQALAQQWEAARTAKNQLAVMMIDIDHFKLFNDAAGHLEGDRCLTVVARTIGDQVRREQDLAARFGGEEFIVLMPATDLDAACAVAERVRTAIAAMQVFHPGRAGRAFVSVSIGVAAMRPDASAASPATLIAAADEALYAAKAGGRDRVVSASRRRQDATAAA